MSIFCLKLQYVLIDLSVEEGLKFGESVFVSVNFLISTSCHLTEKWRVRIFVGYQFFFDKYLLLSALLRAGIAVQGPLVCFIYLVNIFTTPFETFSFCVRFFVFNQIEIHYFGGF